MIKIETHCHTFNTSNCANTPNDVIIKKYIDNDDNARKLYYELIERYVDIKSDIELKMLMNIDAETNFQKTKVFNNVDEFLFTKFKKA